MLAGWTCAEASVGLNAVASETKTTAKQSSFTAKVRDINKTDNRVSFPVYKLFN